MCRNHGLSTEHGVTPKQLFFGGLFEQNNPLAFNNIERFLDADEFYGEDPEGPRRYSNNKIVIYEVIQPNTAGLTKLLYDNFDLNRASIEGCVDLYMYNFRVYCAKYRATAN